MTLIFICKYSLIRIPKKILKRNSGGRGLRVVRNGIFHTGITTKCCCIPWYRLRPKQRQRDSIFKKKEKRPKF